MYTNKRTWQVHVLGGLWGYDWHGRFEGPFQGGRVHVDVSQIPRLVRWSDHEVDWRVVCSCITQLEEKSNWELLKIRTPWNEDTLINRIHLAVQNTLSQTPCLCTYIARLQFLKSGHLTNKDTFFCPKGVQIREVPLYILYSYTLVHQPRPHASLSACM